MTIDKEKYLADEARHLELSKDGGFYEVDTNYMTGYREGMEMGYINALANLEDIIRAINAIEITAQSSKVLNDLTNDYATSNIQHSQIMGMLETINNSENEEVKKWKPLYEYFAKEFEKIIEGMEGTKEKILDLEQTLLNYKNRKDFIYLPYEMNLEDTKITLNEAKEILEKAKPTDELIDLYIKNHKSEYGMYMDLGEDEEEKLSNDITEQWHIEKVKYYNFVQNELKEIYRNRENTSESQAVEV